MGMEERRGGVSIGGGGSCVRSDRRQCAPSQSSQEIASADWFCNYVDDVIRLHYAWSL